MFNFDKRKIIILISLFILLILPPRTKAIEKSKGADSLLIKLKASEKIYKVEKISGYNISDWQEQVLKIPTIEWAEPNYRLESSFLPADPLYDKQWYLDKIKAPQAWDFTKGGNKDIKIAVLDTGVDIDHPDLKDNIWVNKDEIKGDGKDNDKNGYVDDINGWDFVNDGPDPNPKFNEEYTESGIHHGTLIAGVAAAQGNNGEGVTGLAWKNTIMPLRVLDSQGGGNVEEVINAINYAVDNGAKVINLSFVGTDKSYFLKQTLKKAWQEGVTIVAAAGNERGTDPIDLDEKSNYPICLDEDDDNFIIGVAALDSSDKKASFSDYGTKCVDVSAPGSHIYGALAQNSDIEEFQDYYGGYWSGTSIAAPLVSGLAGLLYSINPLFENEQIYDFIINKADSVEVMNPDFQGELGSGRINAYASLDHAHSQMKVLSGGDYIVVGAGPSGGPHVRIFDSAGLSVNGFFAYNKEFKGGVSVAAGDINGDGIDEIITGAKASGGPHVRAFSLNGTPKASFFAYDKEFKGGVSVAVGDINGDGIDEIITGAGPSGGPHVRAFNKSGVQQASFFAYGDNFKGGVNVAAGDINGDGIDEIITGAKAGGGPHVRAFNKNGDVEFQFFAFNKEYRGGVHVSSGDADGDGTSEVITSVGSGASSYVRVFDSVFLLLRLQFLAYGKGFYNGVNVTVEDFDDDGKVEIATVPSYGKSTQIKLFNSQGDQISEFYGFDREFMGGASITTMNSKGY